MLDCVHVSTNFQGSHLKLWTFQKLIVTDLRDRAIPWAFLLLSRDCGRNELNIAITERIRALVACICAVSLVTGLVGLTPRWLIAFFLATAFAANLELFALFHRRNGILFAIGGIFFHQFYYLYSTIAYCCCWLITKSTNFIPNQFFSRQAARS